METEIFYFSGSGNTLALARELAEKLGSAKLSAITGFHGKTLRTEALAVGFAFPVYAFGMPRIMSDFVERLEIPEDAYLFGLCNSGGMPGNALPELARILKRKGQRLACGTSVIMPSNYLPFGGPGADEKQQRQFGAAADKLAKFAAKVNSQKASKIEKTPALPYWVTNFIHKLFQRRCGKNAGKFYVDERCNSCGICCRICPVGNIRMDESGRPFWGVRCEQCMACAQWCPTQAVQIRGVSADCPRYHHPDVSAGDMFVRAQFTK
jgi:ferredoxin